jgi:pimeloyl-ACP methyl ester carboxylesterase
MEAQGRPWQWPAKQEPTEAPPERRGRNSRLHGGKEVNGVLLLLSDGTHLPVTELPGTGPWTFLVLQPTPDPGGVGLESPSAVADPLAVGPEPGGVARLLTRFGRAVVSDLRGWPGWGDPPGGPGFLDLVDDLDQIRTRAGLGRPLLVGLGELAPVALRAAADQPWAWRALILAASPPGSAPSGSAAAGPPAAAAPTPAGPAPAGPGAAGSAAAPATGRLDLPTLVLGPEPGSAPEMAAVERWLDELGGGPGWAGIAPDAPPR